MKHPIDVAESQRNDTLKLTGMNILSSCNASNDDRGNIERTNSGLTSPNDKSQAHTPINVVLASKLQMMSPDENPLDENSNQHSGKLLAK